MNNPVRFLVVDDHPVFRQGLVTLVESNPNYRVTGQAGSINEALEVLERGDPDLALIDISLVDQNGLDLVKVIKSNHSEILVLIISMHDEVVYATRALKAGARGYVMKNEAASVMLEAIQTVLSGRIFVSATLRDRLLENLFTAEDAQEETSPVGSLSDRELQVLELIGQGYGAKEIGEVLNLSVKTVNGYRGHLKEKLKIENAAELRKYAVTWMQSQKR